MIDRTDVFSWMLSYKGLRLSLFVTRCVVSLWYPPPSQGVPAIGAVSPHLPALSNALMCCRGRHGYDDYDGLESISATWMMPKESTTDGLHLLGFHSRLRLHLIDNSKETTISLDKGELRQGTSRAKYSVASSESEK